MSPNNTHAPKACLVPHRPVYVGNMSAQKHKQAAWRNPWEGDTTDMFLRPLCSQQSLSADEHRPSLVALPRHVDFLQHLFPGVSKATAASFMQFMRLTACLESLSFCLEVERFRAWCDDADLDTVDDLTDVSRQIYHRFIFANSPEEINLTHRTRAHLAARLLLEDTATIAQASKIECASVAHARDCASVTHARKMLRLLEVKHTFDDAVSEALVHLKADLYPRFVASQADTTLEPTLSTPTRSGRPMFHFRWPTFARTKLRGSASAVELRRLSPSVVARENKKTAFLSRFSLPTQTDTLHTEDSLDWLRTARALGRVSSSP